MIIGFSGRKQSGKDAAIRGAVARIGPSATRFAFADRIKEIARDIWDLTVEHTDGAMKGVRFRTPPIRMDYFLPEMSEATGLALVAQGCVAHSPRELMQFLGTEYVRTIDPDYWINLLLDHIIPSTLDGHDSTALIADVRFPNEVDAIRARGGVIVRINRDLPYPQDGHASESAIASLNVDHEIDNCGTLRDLEYNAANLVSYLVGSR